MSSHAAQPPALSRWRRDQIHFSPAVRPLLQADRPEWSVASDAEGGSGERGGPVRPHLPADGVAGPVINYPGGLRKGEAASVVPRPHKYRRHEARSGVLVSEANEGQRDVISRGRGTSSGRGLSEVVAGTGCSALLLEDRLRVETLEQLRDVGAVLPAPMRADRREQRSSRFVG